MGKESCAVDEKNTTKSSENNGRKERKHFLVRDRNGITC
jgi:hypothetical protein